MHAVICKSLVLRNVYSKQAISFTSAWKYKYVTMPKLKQPSRQVLSTAKMIEIQPGTFAQSLISGAEGLVAMLAGSEVVDFTR